MKSLPHVLICHFSNEATPPPGQASPLAVPNTPTAGDKGCAGCLGLLVICFVIGLFGQMCEEPIDPHFSAGWEDGRQLGMMDGLIHSGSGKGSQTAAASGGRAKGLIGDALQRYIDGFKSGYESGHKEGRTR